MKKPPRASVSPPIHTTQRVPMRSSKPATGWGSGGTAGGPGSAVWSAVTAAGCKAGSVTSGSGGGTAGAVAGSCSGLSGGAPGTAGAIPIGRAASSLASRACTSAKRSEVLRAKASAANATSSAIQSRGQSNITPRSPY
jgi:hypothetical protein